MKLKWLISGAAPALLLLVTACTSTPRRVSVNESFSGKQVTIAACGSLTVTLDSNATTGYSWQLMGISDNTVLEKTNNVYEAPPSALIGAGGKEVWTFKALRAVKTTLTMEYDQPWTGGQKDAKNFDMTMDIK
jgi:inhibitor of cysteine peptidase